MEYDMDINEFSCFQWNMVWIQSIFFLLEYDMDIEEFSCFQSIKYGYEAVFLFLKDYDMDIEEFSCC